MKRNYIYPFLLVFVFLTSWGQNIGIQSFNTGGASQKDNAQHVWHSSFGETFYNTIGNNPAFTQGFNQPIVFNTKIQDTLIISQSRTFSNPADSLIFCKGGNYHTEASDIYVEFHDSLGYNNCNFTVNGELQTTLTSTVSGKDSTRYYFNYNPVNRKAGIDSIHFNHEDKGGNKLTSELVLTVDSVKELSINGDSALCQNEEMFSFSGENNEITVRTDSFFFDGSSSVALENKGSNANLNPTLTSNGMHTIYYYVQNGNGCERTISKDITIIDVETINTTPDQTICRNVDVVELNATNISETTYSWSGGSGEFSSTQTSSSAYFPNELDFNNSSFKLYLNAENACGNSIDSVTIYTTGQWDAQYNDFCFVPNFEVNSIYEATNNQIIRCLNDNNPINVSGENLYDIRWKLGKCNPQDLNTSFSRDTLTTPILGNETGSIFVCFRADHALQGQLDTTLNIINRAQTPNKLATDSLNICASDSFVYFNPFLENVYEASWTSSALGERYANSISNNLKYKITTEDVSNKSVQFQFRALGITNCNAFEKSIIAMIDEPVTPLDSFMYICDNEPTLLLNTALEGEWETNDTTRGKFSSNNSQAEFLFHSKLTVIDTTLFTFKSSEPYYCPLPNTKVIRNATPELGLEKKVSTCGDSILLTTTLKDSYSNISWSPDYVTVIPKGNNELAITGLAQGDNDLIITIENSNGNFTCSTSDSITVTASENNIVDCYPLEIFNLVTPNGDGIHDYFKILNLEYYQLNNLSIFDRWGQMVFEADSYSEQNGFTGTSNTMTNIDLESGTYFYTIEVAELDDLVVGHLLLKRD